MTDADGGAAMRVYLAGPEVFLPRGREIIARKRAVLRAHGFVASGPHGEFSIDPAELRSQGAEISRRNEAAMDSSDLCIANLSPFRGVSADPGTVYEVGYMIGSGKPVFGYTTDRRDYAERVATELGEVLSQDGLLRLANGERVEDHGWSDNLMLEGGITNRGWALIRASSRSGDPWQDLGAFEAAVARARDILFRDTQADQGEARARGEAGRA